MENNKKEVIIYTDGGCDPNPGPGGYGVVLIFGNSRKELSGGYRLTTNNRMELIAAIKGLEALKEPCNVQLYSDSEYLVKAMTLGWVDKWKVRGWYRKGTKLAANHDLWQRLDTLCQGHQVTFIWVKGHANVRENERCDQLAMEAQKGDNLQTDTFYENMLLGMVDLPSPIGIQEGQPCRKCGTPLIKKVPKRKYKPGQAFYYAYYLHCPGCDTNYQVEEAKRAVQENRLF